MGIPGEEREKEAESIVNEMHFLNLKFSSAIPHPVNPLEICQIELAELHPGQLWPPHVDGVTSKGGH